MKQILKKTLVLLLMIFMVFLTLTACSGTGEYCDGFNGSVFNTEIQVKLYAENDLEQTKQNFSNALSEMKTVLQNVDKALSVSKETSDIARFNDSQRGETIEVGQITIDCFKTAQRLFEATEGKFNPSVFNLVDLWGFSARFSVPSPQNNEAYDRDFGTLPDTKYIDAFKELSGHFDEIVLNEAEQTLYKPNYVQMVDDIEYDIKIDLGGIGKGYACDLLKDIAKKYEISRGYISVGMSSISFLDGDDGGYFDCDMQNPRISTSDYKDNFTANDDRFVTIKNIKNSSISVSGDYQRYFMVGDKRYCHIIDTTTGYPTTTDIASVLVEGNNAAICDAITTALMLMNKEQAAVFCHSQTFSDLGLKRVVFAVQQENKLYAVTNSSDIVVTNRNVKKMSFDVYQNEVTFRVHKDYSAILIAFAVLLLVAVVVLFLSKRNRRLYDNKQNVQTDFSRLRFFEKYDLLTYILIVVVVLSVFLGVFLNIGKDKLLYVDLYVEGVLIYRYDCNLGQGQIKSSQMADNIDLTTKGQDTVLTVYVDSQKKDFNTIVFNKEGAFVSDANCRGKDCTKTASTVKRSGQVALCVPHALKVVGVGETEGNKGVA